MAEYDRENGRPFDVKNYAPAMGRSSVEVTCPFCSEEFLAYVWSIHGGGKKCPNCGAMHTHIRIAYQEIKK